MQGHRFIEQLKDCWFLKKDYAAWSWTVITGLQQVEWNNLLSVPLWSTITKTQASLTFPSPLSILSLDNSFQFITLHCILFLPSMCLWCILHLWTPNDDYSGRTAPLTSKCCILYTYSTNIGTEYFKHGIHAPFFLLQNAVCFIILTYLVPVLFTFYIQGVLK